MNFTIRETAQVIDTNTVFTFEAVLICADAYKRAGSAAPQALAEATRATNIKNNASLGDGIAFDRLPARCRVDHLLLRGRHRDHHLGRAAEVLDAGDL